MRLAAVDFNGVLSFVLVLVYFVSAVCVLAADFVIFTIIARIFVAIITRSTVITGLVVIVYGSTSWTWM